MNRFILIVLALAVCGCTNGLSELGSRSDAHERPPEEPPPPPRVPCRVTGGGQIEAGAFPDSFGGNAQPFRGSMIGHWNHVTHDDGHFTGRPTSIECFDVSGPPADPPSAPANAARFSGTGTFNREAGCSFTVYVEDHGEPGTADFYSIEISCQSGASYSAGDTLLHGNLQIHEVPPGHL